MKRSKTATGLNFRLRAGVGYAGPFGHVAPVGYAGLVPVGYAVLVVCAALLAPASARAQSAGAAAPDAGTPSPSATVNPPDAPGFPARPSNAPAEGSAAPAAAAPEPPVAGSPPTGDAAPLTPPRRRPRGEPVAPPVVASPTAGRDLAAAAELRGRTVEGVDVVGNTTVSTAVILNLVRTREGEKFDPATVVEDYERVYGLKKFANVEARVEPTAAGVIVTFVVTEQKQINHIRYVGNVHVATEDLTPIVDLTEGQSIDRFRINLARQSIERIYRDKNYPFAHVSVSEQELAKSGDVVFDVVEGPRVRVRRVNFIGNNSFSGWKLKDSIKTAYYIFIFRNGAFDPEQVDDDVASLRRFYQNKGFFDARVGRTLSFSPDQTELQVTFVIDEGPRYTIDHVEFHGNRTVSEATLRKNLKLLEGVGYDDDILKRDNREIVRAYSAAGGFIYDPAPGLPSNPDYLQIDSKTVFKTAPGKVDLVYDIGEGKQFRIGRILVKGNAKTKDNVILREMRLTPGQRYDSSAVEDATDRLRGTPYFQGVSVTPIGDEPDSRDLLVDVTEARTASINAGVGINSNGGFGGDLAYEQKNFDIANPPASFADLFSDRAFTGAGQDFRASFDPGTTNTDATISFSEPYIFDQPYSFFSSLYYRDYSRDVYDEFHLGGRIGFGERFNYVYSGQIFFRGEDVNIKRLQGRHDTPPQPRAEDIEEFAGHNTVTSAGLILRRDTTNHGPIQYKGTDAEAGVEQVGALGGDVPNFTKLTLTFNNYQELAEDLLDRRTVLNSHFEFGIIPQDKTPFFERFYGGGIGSIRGFEYRGVTPRGIARDPQSPTGFAFTNDEVGGNFALTGGLEMGFPIATDALRGVVFTDAGDVERTPKIGVVRTSVGFGFRLVLPFFGQAPLALDFALPVTKARRDTTQYVSFSLGVQR